MQLIIDTLSAVAKTPTRSMLLKFGSCFIGLSSWFHMNNAVEHYRVSSSLEAFVRDLAWIMSCYIDLQIYDFIQYLCYCPDWYIIINQHVSDESFVPINKSMRTMQFERLRNKMFILESCIHHSLALCHHRSRLGPAMCTRIAMLCHHWFRYGLAPFRRHASTRTDGDSSLNWIPRDDMQMRNWEINQPFYSSLCSKSDSSAEWLPSWFKER